jgi:hypothetical protein
MNVLTFPLPSAAMPPAELRRVIDACKEAIASGAASGWELGETELGDPQVYLLGPPPNYDCILAISRLGNTYILEDGNGRILFENNDPVLLAERATAALRRCKSAIVARIALAWCALREAIEEKADAMLEESMDLLTHLAPQVASLA